MKCDFDYCIYNQAYECSINEISINELGMCEECIIVSFSKDVLEKEKLRQLQEISKQGKYE